MIYIFLDIDGVLVKEGDITQRENFAVFDDKCKTIFEQTLRSFLGKYKIVISSAWKEVFSLDFIKSHFSPDIAVNIENVTPILDSYSDLKYYRYQEVMKYLTNNNLTNCKWLAIDDIKEHYPPEIYEKLIHTDCYEGFSFNDAFLLSIFLDNLDS